ncbi:hypothetical protein ACIXHQ_09200 [Bacteroides fragilis]
MKTVHSSPSLSPSGTKRQKANLFTNENPEAIAQMRMQSAQKEQHKVMVRLDNRTHVLVAPQNITPEYIEMLRKKISSYLQCSSSRRKKVIKLEELEARRERLVNSIAKLDLKIEEQKEKIAQYYRKQGINV